MARMVIVRDSGLCPALLIPSRIDGCCELLLPVRFFLSIVIFCIIAKRLLSFPCIIAKRQFLISER